MKKVFSLILSVVIILTMLSVNVLAEDNLTWTKYMSGGISKLTEDGVTYYSATGLTKSYSSPGLDIGSLAKEAANADSITLDISFEARIKFAKGTDPEDVKINTIIRADGFTEDIALDKTLFEEKYEGSFFKKIDSSNVMAHGFKDNLFVVNEEWTEISISIELYSEDLGIGLFDKWYLCFQNYSPIEVIDAFELKNTSVTFTTDGEAPTVTKEPEVTKAPEVSKAPEGNNPTVTKAPETNNDADSSDKTQRPTITKDPSKTVAPDSAMSSIIANSCSCNQLLPIISIIIAAIAAILSVIAIIFSIRKKN